MEALEDDFDTEGDVSGSQYWWSSVECEALDIYCEVGVWRSISNKADFGTYEW